MGKFYLRRLAYKKVRKKFIGRGILILLTLLGSIGDRDYFVARSGHNGTIVPIMTALRTCVERGCDFLKNL